MSLDLPTLLIASKVAFGCLLMAIIAAVAVIDYRKMIVPDILNAILAGCGVAQTLLVGEPRPWDAILGALCGFVILGTVAVIFRQARGIDGLGFGDQKFAAAAGLWIGWEGIAPMLLIASCSALVFVAVRAARAGHFDRVALIPFGPFLGLGTAVCWLARAASGTHG